MLNPQMSRGSILPLGPVWVMDITPDAIISAFIVGIVLNPSIFDHQSHFAGVTFKGSVVIVDASPVLTGPN